MFEPTPSNSKQTNPPEPKFVKTSNKRTASDSDDAESSSHTLESPSNSSKKAKLDQPESTACKSEQSPDFPNNSETIAETRLSNSFNSTSAGSGETNKKKRPFKAVPVTKADFCQKHKVEGIPDVYYKEDWIDHKTSQRWMRELTSLEEWYRPTLKVYGREIIQSREIAAFATTPDLKLKYSGQETIMHYPFPPILDVIANSLSSDDCLGKEVEFNHVMLNKYADGSINIGKHSDNLENKVIVTVSLGAERSWIMEKKPARKGSKAAKAETSGDAVEKKRWKLKDGSLLVMQGDTQRDWKHEIPKEMKVKDMRISLTFRQLVY